MTPAARTLPSLRERAAQPAAASRVRVEVVTDLDAAREPWSALEKVAAATPFQRYAWVSAWARRVAPETGERPAILLAREPEGAPLALLPLFARRERGLVVARFAGGKHASYGMGLFSPAGAVAFSSEASLRDLLGALREAPHAVDLALLDNQPAQWRGRANPLRALPSAPSPSYGHLTQLPSDAEAFLAGRLSHDTRRKLRRKERRMSDMGALAIGPVTTAGEARETLAFFMTQKRDRLRAQGISNPFDEPGVRAFLEEAAIIGLEDGSAPIRLYSARIDQRIVAMFGGAVGQRQFSGMFNAFDPSADVSRYSPGELLLLGMVQSMCEDGAATFDLGVGEARYKETWCEETLPLFDAAVALTPRAHLAVGVQRATRSAKRFVKQTPWAMELVRRARRTFAA